jgi:hypothetical protein
MSGRAPDDVAVEDPEARSELCREMLAALPDWFGIEEAVHPYVRDVAELPSGWDRLRR